MRAPVFKPFAVLMSSAALLATGVVSAHAEDDAPAEAPLCSAPDPSTVIVNPDAVDGIDLDTCDVVGVTVEADGVGVVVPEAGMTVTAVGEVADGDASYLEVDVNEAGEVAVSTTEPETEYGMILPDGSFEELSEQAATSATAAAAAYSRCNDYSYRLSSGTWRPGTLYLNSNERLPGNVSKATFESMMVASLNVWKKGTNSCGLTRSLNVPGSISYGNWTYDANINGDNTCAVADSRSVIDFGSLSGNVLGLACTWSSGGVPVQSDVRFDTSDRSWVTSTTGCTGQKFDLRSVVTHELGHVLGLNHATEYGGSDLTMSPSVDPCNAASRSLGAGDLAAIYVKHGK